MSTVKITDLPETTHLNANTANTILLGVDVGSDSTYKFTIATLAEGLFHSSSLKVGEEDITFANTIAQFKSSGNPFLQVNLQNTDRASSGDYVATADIGTNANNFIDMGINGSTFNDPAYSAMKALDGYLYVHGSLNRSADGNLVIGTASANANVSFIAGGTTTSNVVAEMSKYGFSLKNSAVIKFNDNSIQSVAAAPANYTQSAFNAANSANVLASSAFAAANAITSLQSGINSTQNNNITAVNQYAAAAYAQANTTVGVDDAQNTNITLVNQYAGSAFAKANAALANATGTLSGTLRITQDLYVGDIYNDDIYMDGVLQFRTANGNITTPSGQANAKDINIKPGNELGAVSYGGDINLIPGTGGVRNGQVYITSDLRLTGNLIANSANQGIFVDRIQSTEATFSKNVIILGNLTANTLAGNVFFSNVTIGSSQANSIQWFAQTQSPTQTSGQVWYSANSISLIQDTDIAGDRPAISKVLFERVYNNTGSAIPNSSWVRLAGGVTSNSVPFIQLADATSAANSQVEGFVKVGIAAGAYGFVYTRGIVEGMNASTFGNNGQLLFLSTTPGQASNVAPVGANSVIGVAKILSNGSANGKLQIAIANQQAYGKPNGAILFANNNLIQASNTLFINEALGQLNVSSMIYAANGTINRSNTYTGTQTAITVNMLTETWVRATVGASLTITPTGFGPGYETEVVIINPNTGGGAARTITHGCSAQNSSVGATTFVLGGTTTAFVKYYSFDGDLANTYAKISFS